MPGAVDQRAAELGVLLDAESEAYSFGGGRTEDKRAWFHNKLLAACPKGCVGCGIDGCVGCGIASCVGCGRSLTISFGPCTAMGDGSGASNGHDQILVSCHTCNLERKGTLDLAAAAEDDEDDEWSDDSRE